MTEKDITCEIRGAIYDAYVAMGPGLLESVYEEVLCYLLVERGLSIKRQVDVPVYFREMKLQSSLRLDILVENQIIIELK